MAIIPLNNKPNKVPKPSVLIMDAEIFQFSPDSMDLKNIRNARVVNTKIPVHMTLTFDNSFRIGFL